MNRLAGLAARALRRPAPQAAKPTSYVAPEDGLTLVREARAATTYPLAWEDPEPLVSVRIATYDLGRVVVERAIASVLRQTHTRWEAIVVGDACTDDTAARIAALADPRVRFENLPVRGPYPDDARARWYVAGSNPMNRGLELARGSWIAPLDHDDEWDDDHIEVLLARARETRAEVVYGRNRIRDGRNGRLVDLEVGAWPPQLGAFSWQDALCHAGLRTFRYDLQAYQVEEPGDWNLARRLMEAGARFAYLDRLVSTVYLTPSDPERQAWFREVVRVRGYLD